MSTEKPSKGATKLQQFRAQFGLTQIELAQELRITSRALSGWERGEREPPYAVLLALPELARRMRKREGNLERWHRWARRKRYAEKKAWKREERKRRGIPEEELPPGDLEDWW